MMKGLDTVSGVEARDGGGALSQCSIAELGRRAQTLMKRVWNLRLTKWLAGTTVFYWSKIP